MVEVTEAATQQISEYFKGREVSPIRIFLNEGGWGGPSLAMALDEPKETDEVKAVDGFTYVIDKEFLKLAQPVKVDFIDYGFRLTSSIKIDSGCGGCGSGGSCEV